MKKILKNLLIMVDCDHMRMEVYLVRLKHVTNSAPAFPQLNTLFCCHIQRQSLDDMQVAAIVPE